MQLSFGGAEQTGKRKKTRREVFLAEMEQVVPWNVLLALIAPHYPKMGQRSRVQRCKVSCRPNALCLEFPLA